MYYWDGKKSSPDFIPSDFGLEFETYIKGKHYDDDYLRCAIWDVKCNEPPHWYKFCNNDAAAQKLVATKRSWKWSVYVNNQAWSTGNAEKNLKSLHAYADYNDLRDPCNVNSMTIGLRTPQKIPHKSTKAQYLYVNISAPKGGDNKNKVYGATRAVGSSFCTTDPMDLDQLRKDYPWSNYSEPVWTDCMGVNNDSWTGPGNNYSLTLKQSANWKGPNLCWSTSDYSAKKKKLTAGCSGSW